VKIKTVKFKNIWSILTAILILTGCLVGFQNCSRTNFDISSSLPAEKNSHTENESNENGNGYGGINLKMDGVYVAGSECDDKQWTHVIEFFDGVAKLVRKDCQEVAPAIDVTGNLRVYGYYFLYEQNLFNLKSDDFKYVIHCETSMTDGIDENKKTRLAVVVYSRKANESMLNATFSESSYKQINSKVTTPIGYLWSDEIILSAMENEFRGVDLASSQKFYLLIGKDNIAKMDAVLELRNGTAEKPLMHSYQNQSLTCFK